MDFRSTLPQIEFDLVSSFRLPVLYSTAKLRCVEDPRDDLVMGSYVRNNDYRTARL